MVYICDVEGFLSLTCDVYMSYKNSYHLYTRGICDKGGFVSLICDGCLCCRRFSVPIGMSKKEQEQRQTYKQILAYEQDVVRVSS